jgi:hypothetical protein
MSAASDLTSENVEAIFLDSLATSIDPPETVLIAEGITRDVRFHSERLFTHVPDVELMLSHASELFYDDRGAGHTCSELAHCRNGRRWGTRRDVDRLLTLGLVMRLLSYSRRDRAEWVLFPEGTPYVQIKGSLFRLWAVFASDSGLTLTVPFKPETYPPTRNIDEAAWYEPRDLAVAKMGDNPRHVGEAFYLDIVVRGFFEEQLPSWILDPGTLLQVY